jgi:hypothetical protein
MDLLLEEDPFEELVRADHEVTIAFEAFSRFMNSHTAFEDLLSQAGEMPKASFEASARPLMTAVTGEIGHCWSLDEISVESVKTVAASVVRAAISALQQFFKALLDFFSNIDLAATWLSRKLSFLERQVATTKGMRPSEPTVELGRIGRYMRVHGIQIDDAGKLESQIHQLHNVVKVMAMDYRKEVIDASAELQAAARGKTGKVLTDAMVAVITKIPFDKMASQCGMHAAPYDRFKRNNVQATPSLLGGMSLFYLRGDLRERGIDAFRFHGFLFEKTGRNELKVQREYTLTTLQPGQIGELPKVIRSLLDDISKSSNSGVRAAANRSRTSLDTFLKTSSFAPSDMDAVRKTVNTLTHWLQQPTRSLLIHSMSVCRAAIQYCYASIKTYR